MKGEPGAHLTDVVGEAPSPTRLPVVAFKPGLEGLPPRVGVDHECEEAIGIVGPAVRSLAIKPEALPPVIGVGGFVSVLHEGPKEGDEDPRQHGRRHVEEPGAVSRVILPTDPTAHRRLA